MPVRLPGPDPGGQTARPSTGPAARSRGRRPAAAYRQGPRTYRSSPEARPHDEGEAERLWRDGLRAQGLPEAELSQLPGNDPRKVDFALALRGQTTVSQGWIAEKLAMKSAANVSQILLRAKADALSGFVD